MEAVVQVSTVIGAVFTAIGAVASILAAKRAARSKNEAASILSEIKNERNRNVDITGRVDVNNKGDNNGVMIGANSGDVHHG